MVTKDEVIKKLKTVNDPELGINIVDLGLVYDIQIKDDGMVIIKYTLTTPGCPLAGVFDELVNSAVKSIVGVKSVTAELTFEPAWDPSKMSEAAKLQLGFIK